MVRRDAKRPSDILEVRRHPDSNDRRERERGAAVRQRGSTDEPIMYCIDVDDRIIDANDAWNAFAIENGAPELAADLVRGRSLWAFVADSTTETLYRSLVARARQGRPMIFLCRCDVPSRKRVMQMNITAAPDGSVRFESTVAHQAQLEQFALWDRRTRRSGDPVRACSWCKRIEIGAHWIELDMAVDVFGLFVEPPLPPLEQATCPSCDALMNTVLEK